MGRLDAEARMAIKVLSAGGSTQSAIARLLGVTEGAVRYHARRMAAGAVDRRAQQQPKAATFAIAIEHWRAQQDGGGVNLAALHDWLRREHGYDGSLRTVQRYWRRSYPAPAVRARRRVETPPGAQALPRPGRAAGLDRRTAVARAAERRCPATGTTVAEAWAEERRLLTPELCPKLGDADGRAAYRGGC